VRQSVVHIIDRIAADLDRPSPAVKQSATSIAVVLAVLLALTVPGLGFPEPQLALLGVVLVGIATILSLVFTRFTGLERFAMLIPMIDLMGLGAFRAGTGGSGSLFSALIILPIIWLAAAPGRRYIVFAVIGTSLALMFPFIVTLTLPQSSSEWLRGVFTPIVFGVAAAIINELARQSRKQLNAIKEMAEEKERMLQRTVEYAAQLQESEAKYRAYDRLFRGVWAAVTEQSVIGTDATGLIDAWNPGATKILGPTADEAEDKLHIFDFHLPDELEERARELNYPPGETVLNPGFSALVENARLGKAESREWTYVRSDGSHVPVQLSVTKRVDEDGNTQGYLFVASDVTQAREVARLKDEFVGLISHELRTPLSSILGYLELMRDDDDHPLAPEHMKYLAVAERNAHRLLRLVGDLLFTAQVESGKFPLDARDTSLDSILGAAILSARPVADAAGITLVQHAPDAPTQIHGDALRLGQAVDNLISNAIKFTPRGGTVTLALETVGQNAVVTVRDTGMGIAASELDQLFSRFFRATTATRNAVPGVGLGLTITKAIVSAHHGRMGVESVEGQGTCFSMTLPLASATV
jgi:signal transduction histidine kinase